MKHIYLKGENYMNNFIEKSDIIQNKSLVFIKDIGIYGYVKRSWKAHKNKKEIENNYIIIDMIGIEHERWEHEIEKVDDIKDSIRKSKCNMPLETIIEKFNDIDKKYKLTIEVSKRKEDTHSSIVVPYIFAKYGNTVYNSKECKFYENVCYIRDGKLFLPEQENYIGTDDEYECSISCYDTDVKSVVFELYMNIITRIKI